MPEVVVDERTYEVLRLAAAAADSTVGAIIARCLTVLAEQEPPGPDPWTEVPVHTAYLGHDVQGLYVPASRRLRITSGPLAGQTFTSPSAAAGAVIRHYNPGRDHRTNGWRFWHVTDGGDFLDVLRPATPA